MREKVNKNKTLLIKYNRSKWAVFLYPIFW